MSYYQLYELNHAAMGPFRAVADATRLYFNSPLNPFAGTPFGRSVAATAELFERTTRRYGKPDFGITQVKVGGVKVPVSEEVVWQRPFCRLIHFAKPLPPGTPAQPKLVIVAPLSGHYATLLRGTVAAMLPGHDVFITDWADARMVPVADGPFDLDDYIDTLIAIHHALGPGVHVMAVCQPSVPVLAAVALMEAAGDRDLPASMILMGGPIDTRVNPTAINTLANTHDLDWFRRNVIMKVPFPHPGFLRDVYPGFLQISGFLSMNFDRHLDAHRDFYQHLIRGDGDSAEKHRAFYDEYLAVMDLTAEFYLQTVDTVFLRHALPLGEMKHRNQEVQPAAITHVAMLTIEGEHDDISGVGQTRAAHDLTVNLPAERRAHHLQKGVGHYGVFNGTRFRAEIVPRIAEFIGIHDAVGRPGPARRNPAKAKRTAEPAAMTGFATNKGLGKVASGLPKPRKSKVNRS